MDSDSDSDYERENEETLKRVDVGLIDLIEEEIEEMSSDEIAAYRVHLRSPFFPSKVGGKPAWLDLSRVPLAADASGDKTGRVELVCGACKSQLSFLLQIYAPISHSDEYINLVQDTDAAFHRSLYVFVCASQTCAQRGLKVLRSQLARENEFYSYDPPPSLADTPDDNNNDQLNISRAHLKQFYTKLHSEGKWPTLCSVCGVWATKKCSKCNFTYYCSQEHQLHDWTKLNHKNLCSRYATNDMDEVMSAWVDDENSGSGDNYKSMLLSSQKAATTTVFPEHEILIEPELLEAVKQARKARDHYKIDEKKIKEEMESNEGLDQELDALKENDYDKDFEKFKLRSAHESTQVIRYDRGGEPLWCTKYNKLKAPQDIPACEHCGAKRIFEFQVTPQLLNYLSLDESKQQLLNTLDWAGLYVYTCVRSCHAANNTYSAEFIYKQDFVS